MEAPPFANLYKLKHVAEEDSKACALCYKPSNAVVITCDKKDWFYICEIHLTDTNFANVVYCNDSGVNKNEERGEMADKVGRLEGELQLLQEKKRQREKEENSWLAGWGVGKKQPSGDETTNGGEKEGDAADTNKDDYKKQIEKLQVELINSEKELKLFEKNHSKYQLDKVFYRERLMKDYKRRRKAEVEEKLKSGTLFPSLDGLPSVAKKTLP